jgi:broad specificity phosphatase PhoE
MPTVPARPVASTGHSHFFDNERMKLRLSERTRIIAVLNQGKPSKELVACEYRDGPRLLRLYVGRKPAVVGCCDGELMPQRWPNTLWIVRHGESSGNVALNKEHASGSSTIAIDHRDIDVPLSALGERQGRALGRWYAAMKPEQRPEIVLTSPYLRACLTAQAVEAAGGLSPEFVKLVYDERLREREFGILDRLTRLGIEQHHSELAASRSLLGKFYFRPPAGESWCDVILRLRSVVDTLSIHYAGKRVLIVAHQVVVLCFRYLIENLDEKTILGIDAEGEVANCSVTEYTHEAGADGGSLKLSKYNFVTPPKEQGAPVTVQPDANVASR